MTIIVEDGTGMPNAETFVSVTNADAYHVAMNNPAWALATTAEKESALRKAAQYIDTQYKFRGCVLIESQALSWPRWIENAVVKSEWPVKRVVDATCELALRALAEDLNTDVVGDDVSRETVGPLTVEYRASGRGGQARFTVADKLLAPFRQGGELSRRIEVA